MSLSERNQHALRKTDKTVAVMMIESVESVLTFGLQTLCVLLVLTLSYG